MPIFFVLAGKPIQQHTYPICLRFARNSEVERLGNKQRNTRQSRNRLSCTGTEPPPHTLGGLHSLRLEEEQELDWIKFRRHSEPKPRILSQCKLIESYRKVERNTAPLCFLNLQLPLRCKGEEEVKSMVALCKRTAIKRFLLANFKLSKV